jgi:hypothetical protein
MVGVGGSSPLGRTNSLVCMALISYPSQLRLTAKGLDLFCSIGIILQLNRTIFLKFYLHNNMYEAPVIVKFE